MEIRELLHLAKNCRDIGSILVREEMGSKDLGVMKVSF